MTRYPLRLPSLIGVLFLACSISPEPITSPSDDPGLNGYGINRAPRPGPVDLQPFPRALTAWPNDRGIGVTWWDVEGAEAYALYIADQRRQTPAVAERVVVEGTSYQDRDVEPGQRRVYAVAAIIDGEEGVLSGEFVSRGLTPEPQRQVRISMNPTDLDRLFNRSAYSDFLLPASVTVLPEAEPHDVIGVRFRGAGSRRYDKYGFHIRLANRPDWNFGGPTRRGGDRIFLSAMWTDPSALREAIAFRAQHEVGLPAPSTQFAELYLNGNFEGFYTVLERIDREALRGWGMNRRRGGMSLVRDEMKSARRAMGLDDHRSTFGLDLDTMYGTDEERIGFFRDVWEWRGEFEDHDWEALLDLARFAFDTPAGPAFASGLRERFDVDHLMSFLAVNALLMDTDILDSDYWLYRDEDAGGKWIMLPWDKNLTFGSQWYRDILGENSYIRYDRNLINTLSNRIMEKLLDTPELFDALEGRVYEHMADLDRAWVEKQIDDLYPQIVQGMAIRPGPDAYKRQPEQHHAEPEFLPHHVEQLAVFTDLRREWLYKYFDRQAGRRVGEAQRSMAEKVRIRRGQRRCLADANGHTYMCLRPSREWIGSTSVALISDNGIDGVNRQYVVQFTQPYQGEIALFYHNRPGHNWVPREEWAGDQWRLDMVITERSGEATQVRSRVNPIANMVLSEVALDRGVFTITLPFGPVPAHRLSTVGDDASSSD
ncbi:MAG: hypothetical protein EA397_00565 [Deltaproteobacteria bacterium]|nr:MAG: hypothetical protein EA397_00565 [Deltaproteobacteria bacterium]